MLLYESFRHAQGDQQLQTHFISSYARLLKEKGIPIDLTARTELLDRVRGRRLPRGHVDVPNRRQVSGQFEFWWLTMWDLIMSVYAEDARLVPGREQLAARMLAVGGTPEMSSFTPSEMRQLDEGLAPYRAKDDPAKSAVHIIRERFLPNLIRVEWNFQGNGPRYTARPRTDGGDVHESKMLGHCQRAAGAVRGQPLDLVNHIYAEVSGRLTWLASNSPLDPTHIAYTELVKSYNRNHPSAPRPDLHT